MEQPKNTRGQFAKKGNTERQVRSIRLTDEAWNILGEKAKQHQMNRADFLEALTRNQVDW